MALRTAQFIFLLFLVHLSLSHICLIYPPQRGGYDVSTPGSSSCYEPAAPCGTKPPGNATAFLTAGTTFTILFQQNLNHYNPGWPGFLDVAYGVGNNQTSDSQFTILQQIPDYWPHLQSQQTNYSVSFIVPDIDCPVCTLRVRYHPNKPTEPIFHNCADISILKPTTSNPSIGSVFGLGYFGPSNSASQLSTFVNIDPVSGEIKVINEALRVGQRSYVPDTFSFPARNTFNKANNYWMSQGLITSITSEQKIYYIGDDYNENTNEAPSSLFSVSSTGQLTGPIKITPPSSIQQWAGIVATQSTTLPPFVLFAMSQVGSNQFTYSVYWLYENGTISNVIATTPVQDVYVNTFYVEYSSCRNEAYLLTGHENTPFSMFVLLFTFNMDTGVVTSANVQNSQYTIQEIRASSDCSSSYLYSLSPGLFGKNGEEIEHTWSLITIDPVSGDVIKGVPITEKGFFTGSYGGNVYGPGLTTQNQILHLFTRAIDGAVLLGAVNIDTNLFDYATYLNLGEVINVLNVNSLVLLSA